MRETERGIIAPVVKLIAVHALIKYSILVVIEDILIVSPSATAVTFFSSQG